MAKEFPYFKFFPGEWVTGDITLCSIAAQGLFTNILAIYWMKDCVVPLQKIQDRFREYPDELQELIDNSVITVLEDHITIKFLDEQMGERDGEFVQKSTAGKKGMQSRWGTETDNTVITNHNNIEKRREEKKEKESKKEKDNNKPKRRKPTPEELLIKGLNISIDYRSVFMEWLEYKRVRGEKYKHPKSIFLAYKKLRKYSSGNPEVALEIIEDAMSKNYAGFFELKESRTTPRKTGGSRQFQKEPVKKYKSKEML